MENTKPRVVIVQQVFRSRKWIELVYPAIFSQTYENIRVLCQIVEDDGGCEEYIRSHFPQAEILKPGYNIGFAKGHNEIFAQYEADFYMLVNPDLVMSPDYVEQMLRVFSDPQVGAVTGKLLQYDFQNRTRTNVIDTTGVVMSRNGRARDRGQHEVDEAQYDNETNVIAVSGAGCMYRRSALEAVKQPMRSKLTPRSSHLEASDYEYFDEDFGSYWEDVDLSLRLVHAGFKNLYAPEAVAGHGRTAGSSKKGYKNVAAFTKHHAKLTRRVRQLNYKNHIFTVLKNFPHLYWQFFFREFLMLGYIVVFEPRTLGILPDLIKQFKAMLKKRNIILSGSKRLKDFAKQLKVSILS